jgi:hypothetical protein
MDLTPVDNLAMDSFIWCRALVAAAPAIAAPTAILETEGINFSFVIH